MAEAEQSLRWDQPRIPVCTGEHYWAMSVMLPVDPEMMAQVRANESVLLNQANAVAVSPIFCAYCNCWPDSASAAAVCPGRVSGHD